MSPNTTMANIVKILTAEFITHDVKRFILEKPKGYRFSPGQATDVAINKPKWREEVRPLTFTSLNDEQDLELTVKRYSLKEYPNHRGMTEQLHKLGQGDELAIGDPWGTINYKGPGVFIAGGAGVTPFIAILRMLKKDGKLKGNKLIFSNKKARDVILEKEFREIFDPDDLILTLTREKVAGFESGRVDEFFLKKHVKDFHQHFYICGPKQMVARLKEILANLGAKTDSVVFEE